MPLTLLALGASVALGGTPTEFAAGSVIVPMDYEYQDDGILDAYGLVFALLDEGVPVHWVIDSGKERDGPDLVDLLTVQPWAEHPEEVGDHSFAGGPFVVAQADAEVALSVAEAWRGAGWAAVVTPTDTRT